jgi:hypothetical protein
MKKSQVVTTKAGLWIDHKKAVIVMVSGKQVTTSHIESNVEKRVRYSGGPGSSDSHGSRAGGGEETRENRSEGQLNKYYDEVVDSLRDAEAILIFGPGEAHGELKKRLEHARLGDRVVGIETADKMTDNQITAKVRERFAK